MIMTATLNVENDFQILMEHISNFILLLLLSDLFEFCFEFYEENSFNKSKNFVDSSQIKTHMCLHQ